MKQKFRIWDEKAERMVYSDQSCGSDETDYIWEVAVDTVICLSLEIYYDVVLAENGQDCETYRYVQVEGETMEFIGVESDDKVEIYRGDIVEFEHTYIDKETLRSKTVSYRGEVKRNGSCYTIGDYPLEAWEKPITILGNVKQNPGLLTRTEEQ